MNSRVQVLFLVVLVFATIWETDGIPRGGGGRGGSNSSSSGSSGKSSSGAKRGGSYYLVGGLYPARRLVTEKPEEVIKKEELPSKGSPKLGITAWGIIAISLTVIACCAALYYALCLCETCQTTSNYETNLASQNAKLMMEKPRVEENGNSNGNYPMIDMNASKIPVPNAPSSEAFP